VQFGQTRGWAFFDAPSGTQMIDGCIHAMQDYIQTGMANRGSLGFTGDQTQDLISRAREEMRQLVRGEGYRVVFGQNMTSLAFSLGHAVARMAPRIGRSVLVTEFEHFGNVDPWAQPFQDRGGDVDWAKADPDTLRLAEGEIARGLGSGRIDLLAITLAANTVGTIPDVAAAVTAAHDVGALAIVDGVQAMMDQQIDLSAMQPDIFFCSAYKFYGPHLGIAFIREGLAQELRAYKLTPAAELGGEKFETGTQNHEAIAGLVGTLDSLAELSGMAGGAGARATIGALSTDQERIADWIEDQLAASPKVRLYRADRHTGKCAPMVTFRIEGRSPFDCGSQLAQQGFYTNNGDLYGTALARRLGVGDDGGWVRVGVAGYTEDFEAERLVNAIAAL
jgi:selenocysteine lyase/cysteine desulfurase